jgi:succinate-acetate transporter protein
MQNPVAFAPVCVRSALIHFGLINQRGDFIDPAASFKHFTGYEGLVCGFSAIYAGLAQVLNELSGKIVLPPGPVKK